MNLPSNEYTQKNEGNVIFFKKTMTFSLKSTKKSGKLYIHTFKYTNDEGSFLEMRKAIYTCP